MSIDDIARQSERRKIRAYARVMRPHAFLAGRTAAVHLGLSVGPGALLEVGVLAPNRAPRARGVRGVKVAPHLANVIMHDEARTTDAASTWAMLGAELTEGTKLEGAIERLFAEPRAAYLHLHYPAPGCYAARVERA